MLISVVIPAFNEAEYLREAIESVLAQTYGNTELVIVDDGSTDHTRDVCSSYGKKITYIYQDNDGSYGIGARIKGIANSSGVWIATMDQDDRWLPTKLERQIDTLKSDPDSGAIFTGYRRIDNKGNLVETLAVKGASGDIFHRLLEGNIFCNSSAIVRREAMLKAGLPEKNSGCADWDLWLRIARSYPIQMIDEELTEYRIHENQFGAMKTLLAARQTLGRAEGYLHTNCYQCRQAIAIGYSHISNALNAASRSELDRYFSAASNGDIEQSWKHLRNAFQLAPMELISLRKLLAISRYSLISLFKSTNRRYKTE